MEALPKGSRKVTGGICAPKAFKSSGIHAGIKKKRRDLALIVSDIPGHAAGVFTTSATRAACVTLDETSLRTSTTVSAIVVNSGNANACTGRRGMTDAVTTTLEAAKILGLQASQVLVSSTGVIGQYLPMKKLLPGIRIAARELTRDGGRAAAEAICTTDTFAKEYAVELFLGGTPVRIGGIAKGSGMIAPNMATMLAFVTTDAAISPSLLSKSLRRATAMSFNRITVDGDTSTNDMVIALANGASKTPPLRERGKDFKAFYAAFEHVLTVLSKMIVKDGEGATKFVEVTVKGASSNREAEMAGRTICNSLLVKTAIHGEDANWGRILAAVGRSGIRFNPARTEIHFGKLRILGKNYSAAFSEREAKKVLHRKEIAIVVNLHEGTHSATLWTCDLSKGYVDINASYRS
ncbi:MAG TPA: bifunctional glutamate N-acetyltransferase/amino-acid acetyltransferase ArgJ [Bacteroidota bacterium]|nr:bifunctional glutamate N-acetyltransferase/amino-acid acetyltransferase ArgJ [Bacteroidota bacterium]